MLFDVVERTEKEIYGFTVSDWFHGQLEMSMDDRVPWMAADCTSHIRQMNFMEPGIWHLYTQ